MRQNQSRKIHRTNLAIRLLLCLAVIALLMFASTASNTVPSTAAGDGNNTISGYTITDVHYTLNNSQPSNVDAVSFTMTPALAAGGTVKIQLSASGNAYSCTGTSSITCNTTSPQATVVPADQLRVVAAD